LPEQCARRIHENGSSSDSDTYKIGPAPIFTCAEAKPSFIGNTRAAQVLSQANAFAVCHREGTMGLELADESETEKMIASFESALKLGAGKRY
jgi:hypothetical protein